MGFAMKHLEAALAASLFAVLLAEAAATSAATSSARLTAGRGLRGQQAPLASGDAYEHGDDPPGTTFDTKQAACNACVTFYPAKKDGKSEPKHKDANGGTWVQACRAGDCDFRDPQTQPWGGVIGAGSESYTSAFTSGWKPPQNKKCFTQDPVSWYSDCDETLISMASSMADIERVCSYRHQVALPNSGLFAGVQGNDQYIRLGSSHEALMGTLAQDGAALLDSASMCDSDVDKLSSACESVSDVIECVAVEGARTKLDFADAAGYQRTKDSMQEVLGLYKAYCVPLCDGDICQTQPQCDLCAGAGATCLECVDKGGLYAHDLEKCECKKPGADKEKSNQWGYARTRPECNKNPLASPPIRPVAKVTPTTTTAAPRDIGLPKCRYMKIHEKFFDPKKSTIPSPSL